MMSHKSAIVAPRPTASPLIAPMIGCSTSSMFCTIRRPSAAVIRSALLPLALASVPEAIPLTSPPAQNARPAPVRMIALTSRSSARSFQIVISS